MNDEDARTLYCGNLSEKVTEDLLYELFLQAGPIENVKIPKDADGRQRPFSFITYAHVSSVDYALNVFEGTMLFKRTLTLDRKNRNGPSPAASPQVNFNHRTSGGGSRFHGDLPLIWNPPLDGTATMLQNVLNSANLTNETNPLFSAAAASLNFPTTSLFTAEMLAQFGQQMLGAELPPYDDSINQQSALQTKMQRNERSYHQNRQQNSVYSRDDRYGRDSYSRHRDRDRDDRRNGSDRHQSRNHRRRR